jgi:hypothetical protein
MIFINNKYTRCYYAIIRKASTRNNITGYTEKHHIIPESFFKNRARNGPAGWLDGNPNAVNNIVNLTAKEHWVCHLLLCKMTTGIASTKMNNAAWRLATLSKTSNKIRITARKYEELKLKHVANTKERHKDPLKSPFKQSAIQSKIQQNRIAAGTHHMLGGTIQRSTQENLLKEGKHNFKQDGFISSSKIRISCVRCRKETGVSGFSQHYYSCK